MAAEGDGVMWWGCVDKMVVVVVVVYLLANASRGAQDPQNSKTVPLRIGFGWIRAVGGRCGVFLGHKDPPMAT